MTDASPAPPWTATPDGLIVAVRATPRGGRDAIAGYGEDADGAPHLRIRIAAPPVDGAANAALVRLIAKAAGARRSDVSLISGEGSRLKRLLIAGDPGLLAAALAAAVDAAPGT